MTFFAIAISTSIQESSTVLSRGLNFVGAFWLPRSLISDPILGCYFDKEVC